MELAFRLLHLIVDIAQFAMIGDNAISASNGERKSDLRDHAEDIELSYGVRPKSFREFLQNNPLEEKQHWIPKTAGRMFRFAIGAGILSGVVGGAIAAFTAGSLLAPGVAAAAGLWAAGGAALGAFGGIVDSIFDRQEPDLMAKQVDKYGIYLDNLETSLARGHGRSRVAEYAHPAEGKGDRHWQALLERQPEAVLAKE